jgi:hypothetical protein
VATNHHRPASNRIAFVMTRALSSLSPPRFFLVIAMGLALSLALVLVLAVAAISAQSGLPL